MQAKTRAFNEKMASTRRIDEIKMEKIGEKNQIQEASEIEVWEKNSREDTDLLKQLKELNQDLRIQFYVFKRK